MANVFDSDLYSILDTAADEDLCVLADFITDKGEGRISLSSGVCDTLSSASQGGRFDQEKRALIAEEIQRFGGNSIINLLRGGSGVPYQDVVRDVAQHVKANITARASCEAMEIAIAGKLLEESLAKMSNDKRAEVLEEMGIAIGGPTLSSAATVLSAAAANGAAAYLLTASIANGSARVLLGRGLAALATGGAQRAVSTLVGPVGWAITAVWTVFGLASPAYRVTVPCVLHVAYLRQKAKIRVCPACGHASDQTARFCAQCGAALVAQSKE